MAIVMTIVLIVSSFIVFLYLIIVNKKPKALNLPPGPPKLPIVGNILQMGELTVPHRGFRNFAKKYGPIITVQIGQNPTIIISSPRLAEEALKTKDLSLSDRPIGVFADIVMYGGTDLVFGRYGERWRQMKKLVTMELLSVKKIQSLMGVRNEEVDSVMEGIRSCCGEPLYLRKMLTKMNNSIVYRSLFGNNCRQQDALIEAVDEVIKLSTLYYVADVFPMIGFLSVISGSKSKLRKLRKKIDAIFDEIFEERRIKRQTTGALEDDLTDVLFNIKERGGLRFPVTNDLIKAICTNMIVGGTDTGTLTIEWGMAELMRNPDVMNKAQTELREAFKREKRVIESEVPKLVYLKHVIKETLRLHAPLPLLLPRECREECQIGGYDIPMKMQVLINAFACGTDPGSWDDPESFKPERFHNTTTSYDYFGTNFDYIPFGAGRRICPGINFGMANIEQAFAKLLYHFNWQLPDGMHPKDVDMAEISCGTVFKKQELQVIPTLHVPF